MCALLLNVMVTPLVIILAVLDAAANRISGFRDGEVHVRHCPTPPEVIAAERRRILPRDGVLVS